MADPLKSNIGRADPQHPEHHKYIRGLRSTDQLMRQFLKLESGLGNSPAYQRGHVWNFEWLSEDPAKAQPQKVKEVQVLMERGASFEDAFDLARACARNAAGFPVCQECGRSLSPLSTDYECELCAAWRK